MSDIEWSHDIAFSGGDEMPPEIMGVLCSIFDGGDWIGDDVLMYAEEWIWHSEITHYRIPMADYRRIYGDPMDTHPNSEPDADRYSVGADTVDVSDGSTASYYQLPEGATELQHLISYRNMNAQDGEIFRAVYRKGRASHSDALRDARKVLFYAKAEVARLEKYGE